MKRQHTKWEKIFANDKTDKCLISKITDSSYNSTTKKKKIEKWAENRLFFKEHMEKAMAPHSSTLAWKIPWMKEPGRLQSLGSLRARHD